jgi:hypothetical protein
VKVRSVVFAFLIVASILFVSPLASAAFTWTAESVWFPADAGAGPSSSWTTAAAFGGNRWVALYDDANDNFEVMRSIQGAAWTPSVVASTGDVGSTGDIVALSATNLISCYSDTTNLDIYFASSLNSGATWGQSNVAVGADQYSACSIAAFSATTYVVVYKDNTNSVLASRVSTDSGATWGAQVTVFAQTTQSSTSVRGQDVQAVGAATAVVMAARNSDSSLNSCKTTNTGTSWTCTVLAGQTTTKGLSLDVSGTKLLVTYGLSTSVLFCTSSDLGGTYQCGTVGTLTSLVLVYGVFINATSYGVFAIRDTGGVDATPSWYSETTDDAGSWSTMEATETLAGATGSASYPSQVGGQFLVMGAAYDASLGRVLVAWPYDSDASSAANDLSVRENHATVVGSTVIGAAATASVTTLTGFDVDPSGSIAVARTDVGKNVYIYNAQTLGTQVGGPVNTNCDAGSNNYEDGVMAKSLFHSGNAAPLVGFLNCDGSGDSQYFSIRQTNGDVPTADQFEDLTGETCTPGNDASQCVYNIELSNFDEPADSGLGQLGQVKDFPIDYSNNQEDGFGADNREVAWAFASQQCDNPPGPSYCDDTEPGKVGVAMFTAHTAAVGTDDYTQDTVQHHPSETVKDFCLGLDGSSYYLASVVTGQPGFVWPVTFDANAGGPGTSDRLDATIGSGPGQFGSGGVAVACGGGQIVQINGDSTFQLLTRTGTFIDSVAVSGASVRGVSISDEFVGPGGAVADRGNTCNTALEGTGDCIQFGVYVSGTEGVVVDLTGGSIVETGRITLPSGTVHSIRMDRTGQSVWVATSTTIARYDVVSVTTITPVTTQSQDDPEPESAPGAFGVDENTIPGVSSFGANLLFGSIMVIGMAVGVGASPNAWRARRDGLTFSIALAVIGAILGFLVAWGFGFFNAASVFAIVFLAGVFVFFRFRTSGA